MRKLAPELLDAALTLDAALAVIDATPGLSARAGGGDPLWKTVTVLALLQRRNERKVAALCRRRRESTPA